MVQVHAATGQLGRATGDGCPYRAWPGIVSFVHVGTDGNPPAYPLWHKGFDSGIIGI